MKSGYPKYLKDCAYCGKAIIAKTTQMDRPWRKSCSRSCARAITNKNKVWTEIEKQKIAESNRTHGLSQDPLWKVWQEIIRRCEMDTCKSYFRYGGRGIVVSEEWHDFEKFREWSVTHGYVYGYNENCEIGDKLTIERINVNGNYEPSNCTWIPMRDQSKNRRPSSEWQYKKLSTADLLKDIA